MIFGDFLDFKGETSVISGRRNLESQVFNLEKDFVSQGHTLWPYPRRWGGPKIAGDHRNQNHGNPRVPLDSHDTRHEATWVY